jgi:DNA mismatch repair protein MutS
LQKTLPDALQLVRCGHSYKCYEEDAIKAAEILRLTDIIEDDKIPVASFPYHALDTYLPRLIRAGHRIAICDQLEAPKPKKQAQMELFTNA